MSFFLGSAFVFPVIAICAFAIAYMWSEPVVQWLKHRSLGQREEVLRLMELMFIETDVKRVTRLMLALSFGSGALIFLAFWPAFWPGIIVGSVITMLGWSAPKIVIQSLWEKRCATFVNQMVDGMTIMANGIKAGLSVQQSLERVVDNLPNPISQEFGLVLSQMRLGRSLADALNELSVRIPRPDVQMFVTSINILQETGGNMAETFQTINFTIRERQKIEKKIDALTAQARTQGVIISAVPFVILIAFSIADPRAVRPLFTTLVGIMILLVMIILVVIGGMMVKKIAKIEV